MRYFVIWLIICTTAMPTAVAQEEAKDTIVTRKRSISGFIINEGWKEIEYKVRRDIATIQKVVTKDVKRLTYAGMSLPGTSWSRAVTAREQGDNERALEFFKVVASGQRGRGNSSMVPLKRLRCTKSNKNMMKLRVFFSNGNHIPRASHGGSRLVPCWF